MKRILRAGLTAIELSRGPGRLASPASREADGARASLHSHAADPLSLVDMRALLAEEAGPCGVSRWRDADVLRRAEEGIRQGGLHAVRRRVKVPVIAPGPVGVTEEVEAFVGHQAAPTAAQEPSETAWVTIELVDEEGQPVAGEEYWIRTASKKTLTGRLDADGRARVEGVDSGTCSVTFPNLDTNDWEPAQ